MAFTFSKNQRGYSDITFPFMRNTIIPTTNLLFNVRITNRNNMPMTGPCFIYGNHSNYFDPFLLNVGMTKEPTAGVMTRDQFHKTLPRIFMDSIGIVPTSKYVPEPGIIRDVMRMIDQKRMIVIFPEGGRRWDGRPKPIIETTLKLFWKMKIPVHPVQLHGSHLGWPRWAKIPRRSRVEARWLDPLMASDYPNYDDFAKVCLEKMNFEEYEPPEDTFPFFSWKPAKGIERLLYRCPVTGTNEAVFSPDGNRVCSRTAAFDYTMDKASRLIDRDGKLHSLIDMYDHILNMEMFMDHDQTLLEVNGSQFFSIDKSHQLIKLQRGTVKLTTDGIAYQYGSEAGMIPLDRIRYISVEQAHKLSITDDNRTLQFTLNKSSALQWQHYLRRLMKGEKPVRSN
jgi:1-acyl-sn-glycerol-3-phosphate acyltransferase